MTGSGWLDLLVVALAVLAAMSGWRQGAVASAIAFFGVLLGAVAGILIAPHVLVHMEGGRARVLAGVLLIVALVVVGEIAGMVLGRALRSGIRNPAARSMDSTIGALLQAVAVLVAAWLLAIPLTTSSQPLVASSVRGSKVLATVDDLAPEWMRELPKEFSALLDTSGLPDVIGPFGHTPVASVGPPDPSVLQSPTAQALNDSVLRIRGVAPSCQRALEGSGFVIAPERVITNAHVVAGTAGVSVDTTQGTLPARVVLFDPSVDVAILSVPGLDAPPIPIAPAPAEPGQDAIVLGYPGGGPYTATAARVRETLELSGPNIYRDGTVEREVYTVRGSIRQGNSGGPLVDVDGRALGVVFGAAVDNSDTGFVLTMNEVAGQIASAATQTASVETGDCIA
ncbi:MarP family serine protease [Aldersonia sp. NBC_00410]|uniref:MarP family serine protease n=1 Tax=Aldersonia sp. NBC_00410 TaxID=2975954 RepID=UPI00224E5232|nr:MarP family serine protease [Aldersonia sp. NBC_00410]MCX5043156.1 MarP family serine protease [Aldersonia sp. NBC_00410]